MFRTIVNRQTAARTLFLVVLVVLIAPGTWPVAHAGPRMVDNEDGTVTDTATGYMWQQSAPYQQYTFENARAYAGRLTLAGYGDWRVPDRDALLSLVDTRYNPMIDKSFFGGPANGYFWTSTTIDPVSSRDYAWAVDFSNGFEYRFQKRQALHVRVVRDAYGSRLPVRDTDCDDDHERTRVNVSCFASTLRNPF